MFYQVTNALKKIFIMEIQALLKEHPEFHDTLVVNKYQDQEREKCNIILRNASSSSQRMALDNFIGTVESYTTLAKLKGQRGDMIEWVKDDSFNIQNLVAQGFYIIRMTTDREFIIEQYLINREPFQINQTAVTGEPQTKLQQANLNPSSEVITDGKGFRFLVGAHYIIDYPTGVITWIIDTTAFYGISIRYQYIEPNRGPFEVVPFRMDNSSLPGVVLAFGHRLRQGDIQVVLVSSAREDSAQAYSGRWQTSLDLDFRAQDTDSVELLLDYVACHLWATRQIPLADRGITITDISLAGEMEEPEMDVPEEFSFGNAITLNLLVDWELHIPIIGHIEKIYIEPPVDTGIYTDEELAEYEKAKERERHCEDRGVVRDYREGRNHDIGEGSQHFYGVMPVQSVNSSLINPSPF